MNFHLGYVLAMSLILRMELHGLRVLQPLSSRSYFPFIHNHLIT